MPFCPFHSRDRGSTHSSVDPRFEIVFPTTCGGRKRRVSLLRVYLCVYASMVFLIMFFSFITLDTMNCYIQTVLFETKNMIKVLSRVCVLHVLSSRVMFHAAALFCSSDVKQKKG